jgi:hypothetical protein
MEKTVRYEYKQALLAVFEGEIIRMFSAETLGDVKLIAKSLLFSMLPLHNNDKCAAYYQLSLSF